MKREHAEWHDIQVVIIGGTAPDWLLDWVVAEMAKPLSTITMPVDKRTHADHKRLRYIGPDAGSPEPWYKTSLPRRKGPEPPTLGDVWPAA